MTISLILVIIALIIAYGVFCYLERKETKAREALGNCELNVERVTTADKQYMFNHFGIAYKMYETCILLKDYMDEECDGTILGVSNVFQAVREDGKSADVCVVLATHTAEDATYEAKQGFWVEDFPLNDEIVRYSYKEAFSKMMASNYPKPHSRNCVLRKPIGPKPCNPQYVFGNIQAQLWVDAVTGEVRTSNPAFSEDSEK